MSASQLVLLMASLAKPRDLSGHQSGGSHLSSCSAEHNIRSFEWLFGLAREECQKVHSHGAALFFALLFGFSWQC